MAKAGTVGAQVPWERYEAETSQGNGHVVAADRTLHQPGNEATGFSYTRLDGPAAFLLVELRAPANALVLRVSVAETQSGKVVVEDLEAGWTRAVKVDSTGILVYGPFPWSNDASLGNPRRFWNEVQLRIPAVQAGARLRVIWQADAGSPGPLLLDFIEAEWVPEALPQPPGSLSLLDFGAQSGGPCARQALSDALAAAEQSGKVLWIPPGTFHLSGEALPLGKVTIAGAGIWHSRLQADKALFAGTGKRVEVRNLALWGSVRNRDDQSPDNAFNGNFGNGSRLLNLWIEHFKCGIWTLHGTEDLLVENCRIRNTMADGINLCDGTSHSRVRNCHFRNTGDDAMATWSPDGDWSSRQPCIGNVFQNNTVEHPWLANGIGIYGGGRHRVENNLCIGTSFSGGGIHISSAHGALPFDGPLIIHNNEIHDAGGDCYIGEPVGALWIHAKDRPITAPIRITQLVTGNCRYGAITLHGNAAVHDLQVQRWQPVLVPWSQRSTVQSSDQP